MRWRFCKYTSTFSLIITLCLLFVIFIYSPKANAVSGSSWEAGRITDDGVFFNPDTLTAQEVQNFLNTKVPACDTNGSQIYSGSTTRATYGTSQGYPPPYICLKDYSQAIPSKSPDAYCSGGISGGTKSAAQIVWDVAQACDVNPKALIVLLQKEQSLVTDDWPWGIQYRSATGYGCPDGGDCDAQYYGFFNQVYMAARQFQRYAKQPQPFIHRGGASSFVAYQALRPDCGGTDIYMQNQATAGLYNYTPYQPNQAALNNLYGTGDGCSAYGNRNYWRLFWDWFGTPYATPYSWSLVGQFAYTDSTKTTPVDLSNLLAGQRVFIGFQAENMGTQTWTNSGSNPVRAGTSNPFDRSSSFCDSTWPSCNRPATMKEASVAPGETATFEFWYKTNQNGTFSEHFTPLVEGVQWMRNIGLNFYAVARPPTYTWSSMGQFAFTDHTKSTPADLTNLQPGQSVFVGFHPKNTGNMPWPQTGSGAVRAGTVSPNDRQSTFCYTSDPSRAWISCNRPAIVNQSDLTPGQTSTVEFYYTAPTTPGTYFERFSLLSEGLTWMNDPGLGFYTMVRFSTSGTSSSLGSNQILTTGQSITSSNGRYRLVMQNDGNLVLYSINRPLWHTRTAGTAANRVVMQDDGNLVIYDAQNKAFWASGTAGKGISSLTIQNDGNLVLYDSANRPTWYTGTQGQL